MWSVDIINNLSSLYNGEKLSNENLIKKIIEYKDKNGEYDSVLVSVFLKQNLNRAYKLYQSNKNIFTLEDAIDWLNNALMTVLSKYKDNKKNIYITWLFNKLKETKLFDNDILFNANYGIWNCNKTKHTKIVNEIERYLISLIEKHNIVLQDDFNYNFEYFFNMCLDSQVKLSYDNLMKAKRAGISKAKQKKIKKENKEVEYNGILQTTRDFDFSTLEDTSDNIENKLNVKLLIKRLIKDKEYTLAIMVDCIAFGTVSEMCVPSRLMDKTIIPSNILIKTIQDKRKELNLPYENMTPKILRRYKKKLKEYLYDIY